MPLIDTSAWQWSGWKIASYLGLRMEEREQFQAETLLMIILSEVWTPSVSVCCGSNLFHAWTIIIVSALSRQFNFRFVRRRWPKGQNFYTFIRLDSASMGIDPWKRDNNNENDMKCSYLVTPLAHPQVTLQSHWDVKPSIFSQGRICSLILTLFVSANLCQCDLSCTNSENTLNKPSIFACKKY